ncbi:MAG TPA: glycosyltransferase [Acidimicrobiales bacterium]
MRVDQCLPDFAKHDAIGNHVLRVRDALCDAGYDSDIWADRIDERLAGESKRYEDFAKDGPDTVLIYHLSTDSTMTRWLEDRDRAGTRVISYYHNISPSKYFRRWEPRIARRLDEAREQLVKLAPVTSLALAASSFNRDELVDAGYGSVIVAPLLVDLTPFDQLGQDSSVNNPSARERAGSRWLFVGRIAPNKCQHDVVAAFAVYRRLIDPDATLTLVGGPSSYRYLQAVRRLIVELGLEGSVRQLDNVAFPQLLEEYRRADVLVCLSEHEGFCVPLLEAMAAGVPVVAFRAAAVPETVGDAAVLVDDKDPLHVAHAVDDLLRDPDHRMKMIARGRSRAGQFRLSETSHQLVSEVNRWLRAESLASR